MRARLLAVHQLGERDVVCAVEHARAVRLHDVGGRGGRDDGARALLLVERVQQLAGEVFLGGEGAQRVRADLPRLSRVRAEEGRRGADDPASGDRVLQRDVVAADPPAPRRLSAGLAEDGGVVHPGVAERHMRPRLRVGPRRPAVEALEGGLEADDRAGGDEAAHAQAGAHQAHREAALLRAHLVEGEAAALDRRVVPGLALRLVVEGQHRQRALVLVEGLEEVGRGLGHALSRLGGRARHPRHLSFVAKSCPRV